MILSKKGVPIMVYILNQNGQPLMPTNRYGRVRHLLKEGKAKVINRCPFTIQLLYRSTNYTQDITLGVDTGSKHIGLSATTKDKEVYASDIELRNDIVKLISTRRQNRRSRRNRKTRYRKPRFNNRISAKKEGWLAPSIEHKINTHLTVINKVHKILPITKIVVEVAAFDTQLLKAKEYGNDLPVGIDYQNGDMKGFNTREYVLFRDNHKCRCCNGKSKDNILQVHHLESRKTGGNAPNNLVTLCKTCHEKYHKGLIKLPDNITRGNKYNDAAFMGIMRWAFYNKLKEIYSNVNLTYGYITKYTRIKNGLPKDHYIDARCISGNPLAKPLGHVFYQKKVRCHNRQIHKNTILKGGIKKLNQAPKYVKGFQLFDKVSYNNQECFIFGRRSSGSFDIRLLDGTTISAGINYRKLKKLETRKSYLTERRKAVPPTTEVVGSPA